MAIFAAGLPISALGVVAKDLWTAVAFISIATACHQAWSANVFTVASGRSPYVGRISRSKKVSRTTCDSGMP